MGPDRILENTFKLNVVNAKISHFNVENPVDPYTYEESLLKTDFLLLNIYLYLENSKIISENILRRCYFENLTSPQTLSIFVDSLSGPSNNKAFEVLRGLAESKELDLINIYIISTIDELTQNEMLYIKKFQAGLNLQYIHLNFIQLKCP